MLSLNKRYLYQNVFYLWKKYRVRGELLFGNVANSSKNFGSQVAWKVTKVCQPQLLCYMWICVSEADTKERNKWLHPTDTVGCNHLSLLLTAGASGTQIRIWLQCVLTPRKSQYPSMAGMAVTTLKGNIFMMTSLKCKKDILTKFYSLSALKIIKLTTSSAANDENFMMTFPFDTKNIYALLALCEGFTAHQWAPEKRVIIKSEVPTFPIFATFFRGCVSEIIFHIIYILYIYHICWLFFFLVLLCSLCCVQIHRYITT